MTGRASREVAFRPWWRRHLASTHSVFPHESIIGKNSSHGDHLVLQTVRFRRRRHGGGAAGAMAGRALGGLARARPSTMPSVRAEQMQKQGMWRVRASRNRRGPPPPKARPFRASRVAAHRRPRSSGRRAWRKPTRPWNAPASQGGKGIGGGGPEDCAPPPIRISPTLRSAPVRGARRRGSGASGPRARDRSRHRRHAVHAGSETQAADPLIVAREGGERAGISRARLRGVRASAACRIRQSRAAILVRVVRPVERLERMVEPSVSFRARASSATTFYPSPRCSVSARRSQEPPSISARGRCQRVARCARSDVPEPQAGVAGGELVRRRPARRNLRHRAARGFKQNRPTASSGPSPGVAREDAVTVSQVDGAPAYGGTPPTNPSSA